MKRDLPGHAWGMQLSEETCWECTNAVEVWEVLLNAERYWEQCSLKTSASLMTCELQNFTKLCLRHVVYRGRILRIMCFLRAGRTVADVSCRGDTANFTMLRMRLFIKCGSRGKMILQCALRIRINVVSLGWDSRLCLVWQCVLSHKPEWQNAQRSRGMCDPVQWRRTQTEIKLNTQMTG